MESRRPHVIDLAAECAKLTMFRGQTPQTTRAERKGSAAQLPRYRDGLLLLGKSAGTGHWETHPEDELVHVLDGAATLDIVQEDGPHSFALSAGMIAVVPPGAWHRFRSVDGKTTMSAVVPGEHIDLDVDDPRPVLPTPAVNQDETAELDRPQRRACEAHDVPADPQLDGRGSKGQRRAIGFLPGRPPAGDQGLRERSLGTSSDRRRAHSRSRRQREPGNRLRRRAAQSFPLRAGTIAVIPQGTWHRFLSSEGFAQMAVTPFPGETIELDVDDPRTAEPKPI